MSRYLILARVLHILGVVLAAGGILLILLGTAGVVEEEGLTAIWRLYSPFNLANFIAIVITLSPAFLCFYLAKQLGGNTAGGLAHAASIAMREYVRQHGEEAQEIPVDKVGIHALEKMLTPKELQEMEEIVQAYGKVQEEVFQKIDMEYPVLYFPESLLPCPKEKVRWALKNAIKYTDDGQMIESLKSCLVYLENFVPDEEVDVKNIGLRESLGLAKKHRLQK